MPEKQQTVNSKLKTDFGFGTSFAEQLDFFRQKLNLPTERYDDITKAAHDRAFIVAGAGKADLLNDFNAAIQKRIVDGKGLEAFRKDFSEIVQRNGWTGWTGEGTKAGVAWRTRIIYQTNMSTSYAAGRWKQLNNPDLLKLRPYWQYHHADGVMHPRPLHQAWNGVTMPHDHPFWKTHFAPNGWLCHCYITAVDGAAYSQAQSSGKGAPPSGWDAIDPKTGAQVGIDKGFDYAPGANTDTSLRQMVQDKLINYPPAITRALSHDVNRYINAHESAPDFFNEVLSDTQRNESLWLGFVENFTEVQAVIGEDVKGYFVLLPAKDVRHAYDSHLLDSNGQRPLEASDFGQVALVLANADTIKQGKSAFGGGKTVIALKTISGETFNCVFDVLHGKKNRALVFRTLFINGVGGR